MSARLTALAGLAGMLRDRELSRLSAAGRACAATAGRIEALRTEVAARGAVLAALERPDAALAGGADSRWLAALDGERQALRQALALQLAEREAARHRALRALGRAEVLARLEARARPGARE